METLSLAAVSEPALVARHARASRRLRLEVPGLRGRPALARRIEAELLAPELGAEEVRCDPRSGRVLVRYAPGAPLLERLAERPKRGEDRATRFWSGRAATPAGAWHALSASDTLEHLEGHRRGLSEAEAGRRLKRYGPNDLPDAAPRSRLAVLASQLDNFPAMLLLGSSGLSALVRDFFDAGAILSAVGLDAAIGYRIERQNEVLLASWRRLEATDARVIRDGAIRKAPAADLTVGDLVVIRAGDTVPADARIMDAHRLACNESMLTGESESRAKSAAAVEEHVPLVDRTCMVYAGTTVVTGRARAVVTAIGPHTEAARIRELIEREKPPKTPFERRLDELGNTLSLAGAGSGLAAAALGALRFRPLGEIVGDASALAVAAIPEGLPVISTAALIRSLQRLRERGMVVRRLVSAETLGAVTVVCADKTGTLTLNDMRLEVLDVGRGAVDIETVRADPEKLFEDPATLMLAAAVLNSDIELQHHDGVSTISGTATEKALVRAAGDAGLHRRELMREYPRRRLRERDQEFHYVLSVHDAPSGPGVAFVKGAPEQVLRLCDRSFYGAVDDAVRERLAARNDAMAGEGLRVLAVAWKRLVSSGPEDYEHGYTFVGLFGLRDPLRPGPADTVSAAARAGIRTVILTGDQQRTAEAAARAVGLEGEVLDAREVVAGLRVDGEAVLERLRHAAAISRVAPAEKAAIVRALRESGEIVAMAGDGVNDAPAIRAADVGIAIGRRASDISREAADIVLASEDMGSILDAIGEGRVVQDNLRRTLRFLLATNLSEIVLALGGVAIGSRNRLTSLQLLWLNFLSDTIPALALATEPADGDVLARPPAPPNAPLVEPEARREVVRDGLRIAGLAAFSGLLGGPAASFNMLVGSQLGYTLACRAPGAPPDARFLKLLGGTAGLHLAAMSLPPVRMALRLPPVLSPGELLAFGAGFVVPWAATHSAREQVVVRRGTPSEEDPS